MADTLEVKTRESRGTKAARRQREQGQLPAILYGHGQDSLSLSVSAGALQGLLRHGAKLVELAGDVKDSALISDVQWDAFGQDILHVDFIRVSADERIEVEVPVETRGVAPGTNSGGIVEVVVHAVTLSCRANQIPESIEVNINDLQLEATITATQLDLPDGAEVVPPGDQPASEMVIVQCVTPPDEVEAGEAEAGSVEPELVGRSEGADSDGDSDDS